MKRHEFLEEKIALYLASETNLNGLKYSDAEIRIFAKTTPIPEMAKDIVDIVYETLGLSD